MFDYTRASLNKIKKDLSFIKWIFDYGSHIIISIYLIIALIMGSGDLIINIILLGLSLATFIYTIIYSHSSTTKKEKQQAKKTKHWLKMGSLIVKAISFGITLYGMYVSSTTTSPISIIFTTLMLIVWILSVVVEVATIFVEIEVDYIIEGLKYDVTLSEAREGLAKIVSPNVIIQQNSKIEKLQKIVETEREEQKEKVLGALNKAKNLFKKNKNA